MENTNNKQANIQSIRKFKYQISIYVYAIKGNTTSVGISDYRNTNLFDFEEKICCLETLLRNNILFSQNRTNLRL